MARPLARLLRPSTLAVAVTAALAGCPDPEPAAREPGDHGPMAEGIYARLGDPAPWASAEQLATFERGRRVALRRFDRKDGLGPAFNLTFCGGCHERPALGGRAGLYRNFFLSQVRTADGASIPGFSAGDAGGVIRLYYYGSDYPARPPVPAETNVVAQRSPIPAFIAGILASIESREIERRADPDDRDHDGISGRANHDRGFVGRFGRKAQTASVEGFIRGPLMNHLGVTTNPLSDDQRKRLPVDSSAGSVQAATADLARLVLASAQAAAPDGPTTDHDAAPDPELSTDDLFDVVSFAMLLAPARPEALTATTRRGAVVFDELGCGACHTPRVESPRGTVPLYSDLLLHDMGPALADGIVMKEATASEFRTQPLLNVGAGGPYLHDGRAATLDAAIALHGGESQHHADAYAARPAADRQALVAFLESLGGRDQYSPGLLPPGAPLPAVGAYGGPYVRDGRALTPDDEDRFREGRAMFDADFGTDRGVGGPRFNGDSCRACHFDPVIGGAGPRDVNVIRHGIVNAAGRFVPPAVGTILHRVTRLDQNAVRPQPEANVFELRQPPALFGLGLVEQIPEDDLLANADPDDSVTPDGITGRASWTDGGRLGRFGWKAQVPTLEEFSRDAFAAELGMTLPRVDGLTFGRIDDNDAVADPELSVDEAGLVTDYLRLLAPPPRTMPTDAAELAAVARGEAVFGELGCAACHTPSFHTEAGEEVRLYSDLLLHAFLPAGATGIEEASADMSEFRTAPLWGLAKTAPYTHSGEADTIEEAIALHDGEGRAARAAFDAAPTADKAALIAFLRSL